MPNRMLVVDDEGAIREAFVAGFTNEGYSVLSVGSAAEALEVLSEKQVDVIFLDLHLPDMNGVELCKKIKAQNPVACVFAVTGHRSLFELADCREAGFEDYFVKPIRLRLLLNAAQGAFERLERWKRL